MGIQVFPKYGYSAVKGNQIPFCLQLFCFSAQRLYLRFDQRIAPRTKAANQGEVREQLFP